MKDYLSNDSMLGEILGTPALLYTNSSLLGLYTIHTGQDENLFGFDNVPYNAGVSEATKLYSDKGFGQHTIDYSDDNSAHPDADMEVTVGTNTPEFTADKYRSAQFVSQSDDESFHDTYCTYLDLEAVIDFSIFYTVAECSDSYIQNIEYTTYDGHIWRLIPYDLD